MTDAIKSLLEDFITDQIETESEELLLQGPRRFNHNVYHKRLNQPSFPNHQNAPHCIYFYYLRLNSNGKLKVSHYFWPSGDPDDPTNPANHADWPIIKNDQNSPADQNLEAIIKRLALNARPSVDWQDKNPQPLPQVNFKDITWRRRSWIVLFVDEANWHLLDTSNSSNPAIVFTSNATDPACTSNESFFDADHFRISMPILRHPGESDQRTAVAFINHMKKDHEGNDLHAGEHQNFKFSIFFDVKFADGTGVMKVIFDPGGVNDGTPLQP